MPTVECGLITCKWNDKSRGRYGLCTCDDITLKFRLAGDFGRGNIVFIECMMMDLTDDKNRTQ